MKRSCATVDRVTSEGRPSSIVAGTTRQGRMGLMVRSAALVVLLATTWLIVGASLQEASTAVVSAGRTVFTIVGLASLSWWSASRTARAVKDGTPSSRRLPTAYRWWQLVLLAASGVSAYTVFSTVAIAYAGPVLPTLITSLLPAVVLIAESLVMRRAPSMATRIGTVVAVIGAVLYVLPVLRGTLGSDILLGTLFSFMGVGSMAFYVVYFARVNRDYHGPMAPRILPIFVLGTMPLVLWAATAIAGGETVGWSVVGMLALLGIAVYVPVYLLQHRLLLTAGASYTALLGLGVPPLVGIGSAALSLAAVPVPLQLLGIAITLLGMAFVILRKRTPSKQTA